MFRTLSLFAGVLLASAAMAQTTTTTITSPMIIRETNDFNDTRAFGPDDCNSTFTLYYKYTATLGAVCDIAVWATDSSSCGTDKGSGDLPITTVPYATLIQYPTGQFTVEVAKLPAFAAQTLEDGGTTSASTCGAADLEKETRICVSYSTPSASYAGTSCLYGASTTRTAGSPFILRYDTKPPSAPVIVGSPEATNGSAVVSFTINTDASRVAAMVTGQVDGGSVESTFRNATSASSGSVKVEGLTNGSTYDIQLSFYDEAGNQSPWSDPVSVTPIRTFGFWGAYKDAGGTDVGGCSVGLGLMPLLAAALFLMRRSSR